MGRRLSSRFVAGMHPDEALRAAATLNSHGISVTLDSLGENVNTPEEAHRSAAIYHKLLDAIHQQHLDANVSVKLTQMGMDLDPALAEQIVREMTEHARTTGSFVRVDMEGTEYTQATIDMVRRMYHVFISYSEPDRDVAATICETLEHNGLRCWMAPRDVIPGTIWGASVVRAIGGAQLLVLVLSRHSNESQQVFRDFFGVPKDSPSATTA